MEGNGAPRLLLLSYAACQVSSLWSLYRCGSRSSWPQPTGSGGDATPCKDTREERGPLFNSLALRTVAECFLMCRCEMCNRTAVTSGVTGGVIQAYSCERELRDHSVSSGSFGGNRSNSFLPAWLHDRTRSGQRARWRCKLASGSLHSWQHRKLGPGHAPASGSRHCRQHRKPCRGLRRAGTSRRATNPRIGGRLTPGPAGTNPRTGQASVFFYTVCTHEFILDFGGYVSEVVRGSGLLCGGVRET